MKSSTSEPTNYLPFSSFEAEPADQETKAGRQEAKAKAKIEPGKERLGNPGNILERNAQRDHKSYDQVTFQAEGLKD